MTHDPTLDHLPRRFVAQKRVLLLALVMIVAAVVLRFVVIHRQEKHLAILRDEARSLGMPWTLEELNPTEAIPDAENAATYYRQAFAALSNTAVSLSNSNYDWRDTHLYHNPGFYYLGDAAAQANAQAFSLVHRASQLDGIDWGVRYDSDGPVGSSPVSYVADIRHLSNEIGDYAILLQFRGDDRAALNRVRDLLELSVHLSAAHTPFGQLVSTHQKWKAVDVLQTVAPLLRVDDPHVGSEIRRLIRDLDESESQMLRAFPRALDAVGPEFRLQVDHVSKGVWFAQPLFNAAIIEHQRYLIATRKAWMNGGARPPAELSLTRMVSMGKGSGTLVVGPLVDPHGPLVDRLSINYHVFADLRRKCQQEIRLTRVALAVRLFRVERKRWPKSTDELVPEYLPSVPTGVDAMPGARVEFTIITGGLPNGDDRPMIYVDYLNPKNNPDDEIECIGWQSGSFSDGWDNDGRQWRDVTVWPLTAYPRLGVPRNRYSGEFEPGFEASGLAPSANSPPPKNDVYDPNAPGNEY